MIELLREPDSPAADHVEDALRELSVAHRVVVVQAPAQLQALGEVTLPAIRDGERVVFGAEPLRAFLEETARLMERWQRFQSDACYVDDDGKTC
ncbi:MAG: hypothetical protein AB2A00_38715 [Myxococcota bacterium]